MTSRETCRLCLTSADLRASHIIPEFCYRPTYDSKHRARRLATDAKATLLQKGFREPLLCAACEQNIGRYENYFADLWYHSNLFPTPFPAAHTLTDLHYDLFKCFHLSILWRASVSSRDEFTTVSLGARHEELIRTQLLSGDGGSEEEYPFWCYVIVNPDGQIIHELIARPGRSRYEDHIAYYFIYAGCEWVFFVSHHPKQALIPGAPTKSGKMLQARTSLMNTIAIKRFTADRQVDGYFASKQPWRQK